MNKEMLLERKNQILEGIQKLNNELIDIECELEKIEDIPLEICWKCEYCYTNQSLLSLQFGRIEYETTDINEEYNHCPICQSKIKRHPSFSNSLKLMRDDGFLTNLANEHSEYLSKKSLSILISIIYKTSVPSFVLSVERDNNVYKELDELMKKDYVRIIDGQHLDYYILILNAKKLKLHEDEAMIKIIGTQNEFNNPYVTNKRAERLKNLVNDFTEEDRDNLLHKFNGKCAFTGKEVNLHMDHVIPVSWEIEGTTLSNMLPIWDSINSSKNDNNVFEWYKNNAERFDVKEELFINAMTYIAELNNMTFDEYKDYVYECEQIKNGKE